MIFKVMISVSTGSFGEAVEDQKPCGQVSQMCCSGGSWRNEMEFLHNICTTGLVKSLKEKPVYTSKLMACTEQEVSFAVMRKLFSTCDCFAVRSIAAHLVCHL